MTIKTSQRDIKIWAEEIQTPIRYVAITAWNCFRAEYKSIGVRVWARSLNDNVFTESYCHPQDCFNYKLGRDVAVFKHYKNNTITEEEWILLLY